MAHTTATPVALPTLVLCKLTADAWSSFLGLLDLTGDTRFAAGMATSVMQARLMLWMEETLEPFAPADPEIHLDQHTK
ncbi:hypothetical protein ACFV2D_04930 [Streptomyces capillispiralis]|uniref:hypothetical protein n=1 Tax=Streptomyces capillispiralis TaxID=68182 RepID=UPI00367AAAC5